MFIVVLFDYLMNVKRLIKWIITPSSGVAIPKKQTN